MDLERFKSEKFNADDYVKHLVKEMVAGSELSEFRKQLTNEKEGVSVLLKRKVFENYTQFVETAKEISHLESEMYQLSHLLVDQRSLIEKIKEETTLLDDQKNIIAEADNNETEQDQNKKALAIIQNALIGYSKNLEDKIFLHEGSLIELDLNDYRPICRAHLFLFNDILIVAKIKHDKKLEFMSEYETKKLAVVNIKELTGVKNAINIITNEGNRIFQTINAAARTEWIEKFEATLKFNQPSSGIPAKSRKGPAPQPPKQILQKQRSSIETQSICSDVTLSPTTSIMTENLPPEWLILAPEEIQSEIAQRHFEDSLILIQKCEDYVQKNPGFYNINEIQEKMKNIKALLSSVLLHELSNAECRDLQSLLRSSRRLLKLLVEMDKSREASTILLKICTTAIRTSQRHARRNNLPVSELFFCDLAQVASEFLRAFQTQAACTSALTVWSNDELQYFAQQIIIKHYLTKGSSLEAIAKVVESVREPCQQLTKIGLDLSYYMEGLLRLTLEHLIEESRIRLIENINRTEEVSWQPYNLVSKNNLRTLLKEMMEMGIDLNDHVTGDIFINLSQSTVDFCRHFLIISESCAIIGRNSILKPDCEKLLRDLFVVQHNIKPNAHQNVDLNFVTKNKSYLVDTLLPVAIKKFEETSDHNSTLLSELHNQLRTPKPKPRNVYKIDL